MTNSQIIDNCTREYDARVAYRAQHSDMELTEGMEEHQAHHSETDPLPQGHILHHSDDQAYDCYMISPLHWIIVHADRKVAARATFEYLTEWLVENTKPSDIVRLYYPTLRS